MRRVFLLPILLLLGAGCGGVAFDQRDGGSCSYDNSTYQAGESFPSKDGCNSCSCTDAGGVICTQRACADTAPVINQCQTDADCAGQNLDTSFCDDGQWACVKNMCELQCGVSSKL